LFTYKYTGQKTIIEIENLLLTLQLPKLLSDVSSATIEAVHISEGQYLTPGMKILDLRIDMSSVAAHDCPPVSFYRLAFRDRAWLRRLDVARGDAREAGDILALFSTEEGEAIDAPPGRAARIATAGIIHQSEWWSDPPG
jgi:hypothetical protein